MQNKDDAGTRHRYITSSTVIEYQHKFNTMHAVNVGFNALYDFSARDTVEYPMNKTEQAYFFPAIHAGYDFMFWRLAIKLQVAYNLTSINRELKGNIFVRPAIRYEINKRLFTQLGLKTMNGATADWVEFGLGYKLFRVERKR